MCAAEVGEKRRQEESGAAVSLMASTLFFYLEAGLGVRHVLTS